MRLQTTLATILQDGDWETTQKPIIVESPLIGEGMFNRYRNGLRVNFLNEIMDEIGWGRAYEGEESRELYSIDFVQVTKAKLRGIIQQARSIMINYGKQTDKVYQYIGLGQAKLRNRVSKWTANMPVECYKKGKLRG